MASSFVEEVLPPILDSTSALFDGTNRLYLNYECPFYQRVWIVRNYKGDDACVIVNDRFTRQDQVNSHSPSKQALLVKEKLYPENKVPSLEHNDEFIGESLDLIKYLNSNFEGPALLPDDPAKLKFAEELVAYCRTFINNVSNSFKGDPVKEACGEFDYLETALEKFDDGPFFLGHFSQVDTICVPFIERFHIFLQRMWKYDVTFGRPKLAAYIEEINKIDTYKHTKCNPKAMVELYTSWYLPK